MKRIICVLLCCLLLASLQPVRAEAATLENHFEEFQELGDLLYGFCVEEVIESGEPFSPEVMIYVAATAGIEGYDYDKWEHREEEIYYGYAVPFDKLEEEVAKHFTNPDISGLKKNQFYGEYIEEYDTVVFDTMYYNGLSAFWDLQCYEVTEKGYSAYYYRAYYIGTETEEWGSPVEGLGWTEGKEYYVVNGEYYGKDPGVQVIGFVEEDGVFKYDSLDRADELPAEENRITADTVIEENAFTGTVETDTLTLDAQQLAFPFNTVVAVKEVTQTNAGFAGLQTALEAYADFRAFDVTATHNGQSVQPNGKVKLTFRIPEGFDPARIEAVYVSDTGAVEVLNGTIDGEKGTVTVETDHFSYYALAQKPVPKAEPENGSLWLWIGVGAGAVVAVTVMLLLLKKKK